MRVPRQLLGKFVEITWRDPTGMTRQVLDKAPKGRAALATWREYGVIDDITDGVVRIVHSAGSDPQTAPETTDEICYSAIDEALVERVRVFEPIKEEAS